jgi:hypothetical protein
VIAVKIASDTKAAASVPRIILALFGVKLVLKNQNKKLT